MGKARQSTETSGWSIFQRKDGMWVGRRYLSTSEDGKQNVKVFYSRYRDRLEARIAEYQQETIIPFERGSFADYLDQWLNLYVRHALKPRTIQLYSSIVENHLKPTLGHLTLSDLNTINLREAIWDRLDDGKYETARLMRVVLQSALDSAVDSGLIGTNPARKIRVPKGHKRTATVLDDKQAGRFIAAVDTDRYRALWYVFITMGLRSAEARGLRWRDIDFDRKVLTISHQIQTLNAETQLVNPKSESSLRTLPIPATTYTVLLEQRAAEQDAGRGGDDDYLCYSRQGTPVSADRLRARLRDILANVNLPDMRLHDLRHTCATLLISGNVPMKTVQKVLGHSNYRITADLYSHVLPGMLEQAAEAMDEVFA